MMALYNFILTLSGVTYETEGLEDALHESGCDDALICAYGKSVYLEFDREAASLDLAIGSAIENIESAGIGAIVKSIDSVLVGLSDIAELTNMTRQAIALLKDGTRGKGNFPSPVQRVKGQSPLWNWADVAIWLQKNGRLEEQDQQVINALTLNKWDLALRSSAVADRAEIENIIHKLIIQRQQHYLT